MKNIKKLLLLQSWSAPEMTLINDLSIGLISILCLVRLKKEIVPSNIPVRKLNVILKEYSINYYIRDM